MDVGGSALLGARISGPEIKVPIGPVVVKSAPEVWGGLGGKGEFAAEVRPDGTLDTRGKAGVSPLVGGSLGLGAETNEDFFRWLFPEDGN